MATAKEATMVAKADSGAPSKIKVVDDAGGSTVYTVRYDKPIKRPATGFDLVYDDFHPEIVGLDTENGATKLRADKGLPNTCVILINLGKARLEGRSPRKANPQAPMPVQGGFVEGDYEFYPCEAWEV